MRVFVLILFFGINLVTERAVGQNPPGSVGVYADAAGTTSSIDVPSNTPYHLYIVAFDMPDFFAYELGLEGMPLGSFALLTTAYGPAPFVCRCSPASWSYVVGTGGCVERGGPIPLISILVLSAEAPPPDTIVRVVGSVASSFEGRPGYVSCDPETLISFVEPGPTCLADGIRYPVGSLILNPTTDCAVSDHSSSFGSVKARFH